MPDVDPNERIDITNPNLPDQVGSCFRFQLPVFEASGWVERPRDDDEPAGGTSANSGDVEVAVPQETPPINPAASPRPAHTVAPSTVQEV